MIFNASIKIDEEKAKTKFQKLINEKKTFELKEKKPTRSLPQNRYLHLILSYFALEYGETAEYVKQVFFKQIVNKEIFAYDFVNKKTGEIREAYKSTSKLSTSELTMAIDRFRDYSSKEAGIYLPEPSDLASMSEIEKQISNEKKYL